MSFIRFDIKEIIKIADEVKNANKLTPTYEDLWNPAKYPGGDLLDEGGNTESEVVLSGGYFNPDWQQIDVDNVSPQLLLMADYGVYIISNISSDTSPIDRGMICYAQGCHPEKDKGFARKQKALFGEEGGSLNVPLKWLKQAEKAGKQELLLELTDVDFKLVTD